ARAASSVNVPSGTIGSASSRAERLAVTMRAPEASCGCSPFMVASMEPRKRKRGRSSRLAPPNRPSSQLHAHAAQAFGHEWDVLPAREVEHAALHGHDAEARAELTRGVRNRVRQLVLAASGRSDAAARIEDRRGEAPKRHAHQRVVAEPAEFLRAG